ncbi:DUF998 domain-containing protein [Mycobacterium sp. OTB74]|uniref:DUF998 domain-containing protein n=1 Tax=Mycobacterium sp. OTB74 TaxID=1853452 RepID=UPI00247310B4|nr:DUF998 domain-containing protein [Mycobacterium sp. OTB74]MDH6244290.1 putative small integral membrane protein [Mycobacterium sp. OTB74]
MPNPQPVLNRGAAATRSLLGWGVVAGPFYLVVGVVLGTTRPGFDFTRHALSLLMLGHLGWIQRTNFVLCGLMVIAAGMGVLRAIRSGRGLAVGGLVIAAGVTLILAALFVPDPVSGFPPGAVAGSPSAGGMMHLLCGATQLVTITASALAHGLWSRTVGQPARGALSIVLAIGILGGFIGGVILANHTAGIALLWLAVVCEWVWLALACAQMYQWSPHPLGASVAPTP